MLRRRRWSVTTGRADQPVAADRLAVVAPPHYPLDFHRVTSESSVDRWRSTRLFEVNFGPIESTPAGGSSPPRPPSPFAGARGPPGPVVGPASANPGAVEVRGARAAGSSRSVVLPACTPGRRRCRTETLISLRIRQVCQNFPISRRWTDLVRPLFSKRPPDRVKTLQS